MLDRPFGLPELITTVAEWPRPPSTNRIWNAARGRVHLSPAYAQWLRHVDAVVMAMPINERRRIDGAFEAHIYVAEVGHQRSDIDNRCKSVLDAAQRTGLVANDHHCRRLTIEWCEPVNAPSGCRLILRELATPEQARGRELRRRVKVGETR